MDENTLRKVVEEVVKPIKEQLNGVTQRLDDPDTGLVAINSRLDVVTNRLDDPDTGLVAINRRLDANTGAVIELEKTVKGYADMYQINDSNIRKMEKRLETVEEEAGIKVPPELRLESFAEAA